LFESDKGKCSIINLDNDRKEGQSCLI